MPYSVIDDAPMSRFHWKIATLSAGGPFLDGWVLTIIGIVLIQAEPALDMTSFETALTGAGALAGMLVGGLFGGYLCDRLGRKVTYTVDLVALIVCSVLSAFVSAPWQLIVLRVITGIAVGADYPIAASLLTEFVPRRRRGLLLASLVTAWFVGACVSYVVGYLLAGLGDNGWRWMLASSALPALIIVLLRTSIPESPRWLLSRGRDEQAQAVLQRVFGPHAHVSDLDEPEAGARISAVLRRSGYVGRISFVVAFQSAQIIPLYAIYTFLPQMLKDLGFTGDGVSYVGGIGSSLITLVGNVIGMLFMDRWGRRPVLILPFIPMVGSLLLLGLIGEHATAAVITGFSVYSLFSGITGLLVWSYPGELFPTGIRSTAIGIITGATRVGAAVGTFLVPLAISGLGIHIAMLIGAAVTASGLVVSVICAPETKDRPLSETSAPDGSLPRDQPAPVTQPS
ncbi:MFS transporter [Streptomyces sp. GMR22]|uniref:MFS transporter n=1 Tax=Streptomyces sp. GMR22 TaxID=2759524 RepID=UPI0015F9D184|nr:MFS transporter [Streptomyces sp. GMR22]MBA6440759.1 MFS transporter [Streptomyces sp. GMR22]